VLELRCKQQHLAASCKQLPSGRNGFLLWSPSTTSQLALADMASSQPCLHGPDCGHPAIRHEDHVGFLQDGDLHCYVRQKGTAKFRVEKHKLDHAGPCCSPTADELEQHTHHDQAHPCNCDGTLAGIDSPLPVGTKVRHGDHYDFLVGDAIHHRKGDVCMEHGKVELLGGEELERHMYMFDVPTGIGSIAVPYSTNKTSLPFWIMLV
jgi:hypothetical protein